MAQNCTDYHLCFDKRVDTNGDTIVDVLLIDPPDSVGLFRTTVEMSAEAFDVNTFDIDTIFLEDSPTYSEGGTTDQLTTSDFYFFDPRSTTLDTVKLYSFSVDGPPGECIDLSFGLISSGVFQNGALIDCFPDTNALKSCITSICIPSVNMTGVVETLVDCRDSVANDFGMRDVIVSVFQDFSSSLYDSDRTTSQGNFSIIADPGHDYVFTPTIDTSRYVDTCGVTEADILRILEHLSGVDPFDFPYEYIAANTDQRDSTVNTFDVIRIINTLLGNSIPSGEPCDTIGSTVVCDSIPAYLGWEIIPTERYLDLDDNLPLDTLEILSVGNSDTLYNVTVDPTLAFTGIKRGDVNLTCTECYRSGGGGPGGQRNFEEASEVEVLTIHFPLYPAINEIIEVPVYASDFSGEAVLGLHLWANPSYLTFDSAIPSDYLPDERYFHSRKYDDGRLSIIWFNMMEEGAFVESNKPLFYLRMKVLALPGQWGNVVALQNLPGRNVIYSREAPAGQSIVLNHHSGGGFGRGEIGQMLSIVENPFQDGLRFTVTSGVEKTAITEVLNINGKRLLQNTIHLQPGKNDVMLEDAARLAPGTYILRVVGSDGSRSAEKVIKQ